MRTFVFLGEIILFYGRYIISNINQIVTTGKRLAFYGRFIILVFTSALATLLLILKTLLLLNDSNVVPMD